MKYSVATFMLLLLVSPCLLADVPSFVTYSGRLTDGTGWGESTTLNLMFVLHPCGCTVGDECPNPCTGGPEEWVYVTTHKDVAVVDGYFTVNLGMCDETGDECTVNPAQATFPSDLPGQMWVEVMLGGVGLEPWQPVGSVPYAVAAKRTEVSYNGRRYSLNAVFVGTTWNAMVLSGQGSFNAQGKTMGLIQLPGYTDGYAAAKRACELVIGSQTAHMCTSNEMVLSSQLGVGAIAKSWMSAGAEAVYFTDVSSYFIGDCNGWRTGDHDPLKYLGPIWHNNRPSHHWCTMQYPIACCDFPEQV